MSSISPDGWLELMPILETHRIGPLLYWKITGLPPAHHPPRQVVERLRKVFLWSFMRSVSMERQLRQILEAFSAQNIHVLLLKGPALARTLYAEPATRPSADIDLLIRPEDFLPGRKVLEDLGYHGQVKLFETFRHLYCQEEFVHSRDGESCVPVELHWDLHNFSGFNHKRGIDGVFENAVEIRSPRLNFKTLSPVDALVHAALHLTMKHDQDILLIWLYDVALLARSMAVPGDWGCLQERSSDWSATLAVQNCLKMAMTWLGLKLPLGFSDFGSWPRPTEAESNAWLHSHSRRTSTKSMLALHWPASLNRVEKIKYICHLLFPDPEFMRLYYPSSQKWLLPLSYFRRWWKWVMNLAG
jgi:hypothetical protein